MISTSTPLAHSQLSIPNYPLQSQRSNLHVGIRGHGSLRALRTRALRQMKLENKMTSDVLNDAVLFTEEAELAIQDWAIEIGYNDQDWRCFRSVFKDVLTGMFANLDRGDDDEDPGSYDEEDSGGQGDGGNDGGDKDKASGSQGGGDGTRRSPVDLRPRPPKGPPPAGKRKRSRPPLPGPPRSPPPDDLPKGQCPTCHTQRAECFQPGDWACGECGEHNTRLDTICRRDRCRRPRQAATRPAEPDSKRRRVSGSPGEVGAVDSAWCRSCLKFKKDCYKRLDWCCPLCFNHNFARKQVATFPSVVANISMVGHLVGQLRTTVLSSQVTPQRNHVY